MLRNSNAMYGFIINSDTKGDSSNKKRKKVAKLLKS